ncbi:ATP-dependent RNA helicase a-like protein [Plakobranchus ocellatus]|uniref:RNA helicase n=1 Tax=Plakobranchus ocellatus TaxID=259542 RepID=A0AAV4AF09_9GAST|nr:ATP-dependent RNA helicase a-like protein [Plakobranchus ocellatus]
MDVKQILYSWCGKKKCGNPTYEFSTGGPKHRIRFKCEVHVETFDYVGVGNSTNKKDAQGNAARDFIQFLVREGHMSTDDVPPSVLSGNMASESQQRSGTGSESTQSSGILPGGTLAPHLALAGESIGASCPPREYPAYQRGPPQEYMDRIAEKRRLEESEDCDFNAELHGNWTMENAKSRLHQFLQMNKIQTDYKYHVMGPDHNRSFAAEMSFYVKKMGVSVHARETGSNKQIASKSCALSLVRQLYHMKVIEANTGQKKKKDSESLPAYEVVISEDLEKKVDQCLSLWEIQPVDAHKVQQSSSNVEQKDSPEAEAPSVSLMNQQILEEFEPAPAKRTPGVVSWAPPLPNWNPWTNCNIDEGPLASASLEDISQDLWNSLQRQYEEDANLNEMLEHRAALPVHGSYQQILQQIQQNQVVLIRGETGCGKTTQVIGLVLRGGPGAEENKTEGCRVQRVNADFTDNTTPVINTAPVNDELDHHIQDTSVFTSQTSLDTSNEQANTSTNNKENKSISANPQYKLHHKEENKQMSRQTYQHLIGQYQPINNTNYTTKKKTNTRQMCFITNI